MTNEDFQKLVLQELKELKLNFNGVKSDIGELKSDVSGLKSDVGKLKSDVSGLKSDVGELKSDVKELNRKMDISYEQIAGLLEFRTETTDTLKEIKEEIRFLSHKEQENEKELFKIKNKLKIG